MRHQSLRGALASAIGLSPIEYFHWTFADDVTHIILGFALAIIGGYGLRKWKELATDIHRNHGSD